MCIWGNYVYRGPEKRSKFEDKLSAQIRELQKQEEYEKYYINYEIPATKHKYIPDFVLPNGIIIEAKGIFEREDRQKHLYVKEQNPDLDIRFVFQNPKLKLYKGSKTTYADWAEKNGFKYSTRQIPDAWFREPKKNMKGLIPKNKK